MTRVLLFLAFLCCSVTAVVAQTSLAGKVTDPQSGEPIIFANIALYRNGVLVTGDFTDDNGNYSFGNIDPGTYEVEVSYTGYQTTRLADITVLAGKVTTADLEISTGGGVTLDEVVVVDYKKPLFEKDQTTSGGIVTSDEIRQLPTRNINALAATTAGLATSDEGGAINVRGSRSNETDYYVDGIRVQGNLIPESEIEQLQVITGGIEARYGDVTGGVISITTKGPSNQFNGGVEMETSQFLDPYNNSLVGFNLTGPILKNKKTGNSIIGYRLSGRFTLQEDDDPSAVPIYRIKDDKLAELQANPLLSIPVEGQSQNAIVSAADFLRSGDVDVLDTRPFEERERYDLVGKIDARLSKAIDISLGGNYSQEDNQFTPGLASRTINSHNNPINQETDYRVNFRFRHRLGGNTVGTGANQRSSTLQNASYTIQLGYENQLNDLTDPRHGQNYFDYGYIGKFDIDYIPIFEIEAGEGGIFRPVHADYRQVLRNYDPSVSTNPVLANYNLVLPGVGTGDAQYDAAQFGFRGVGTGGGGNLNIDDFININGQLNNLYNNSWNFHTNVGQIFNSAQKVDQDINTLQITSSFDLVPGGSDKGRHSIQFGLQYEGRVNRSYNVAPRGLWTLARQLANEHIPSVDAANNRVVDSVEIILPGLGITGMFPVYAPTSTPLEERQFFRNVRESLGVNNLDEYVNIDGLSPDQLSLDMFSAKELNDAALINYLGYDYLGNEFNGTFDEFFTMRDPVTGLRSYPVAPNRPQYLAAYLQDKFTFRDIIFRLGVRVDRYDANTKVLRDPYSLYAIQGAGDFYQDNPEDRPGNIGDDFAVYVTEAGGDNVQAYRDGDQWYQADGTPANSATDVAGIRDGLVFPAYENPDVNTNPTLIKSEDFTTETSFEDYEVQWNVMPRMAFSFPISDDANFFAHYDVLVQRPASNTIATALDYFYFVERASGRLFNNPDLKPQRTIDYEIGFQQKVSNTSAIKMSAYYKEMRDMIQRRLFFPVPIVNQYETFDNQDFGTVKGFSFSYDLRRTNYVQINANYTLQFADGTGSDANSQAGLTNRGNLRTLFPLSFDERHRINLIVDYRLDNRYAGPGFLRNVGVNLQTIAVSGRPYTAALESRQLGGAGTQGGINGSRQPWNLTLNTRIDKNFQLGNGLGMNVYVRVSNLLDRRNTIAVYSATGSPEDDGFLRSTLGQQQIATISGSTVQELDAYLDSYQWRILNPNFFSLPRRIFAGAIINF